MSNVNIGGLDLGKTKDPSAFCLNTRMDVAPPAEPPKNEAEEKVKEGHSLSDLRPAYDFNKPPESGSLTKALSPYRAGDAAFDEDAPKDIEDEKVVPIKRYYACRMLHQWARGTSYPDIVNSVRKLDARGIIDVLVVDNTGVGAPVVDMFRRARMRCRVVPVDITAGRQTLEKVKEAKWSVPKVELVAAIQVAIQQNRWKAPEGLPWLEELLHQLREFQFRKTQAANETYEASEGEHDDLLIGASLSLWFGERCFRRLKAW